MKKILSLLIVLTVLVSGTNFATAQDTGGEVQEGSQYVQTVVAITGNVFDALTKEAVSVKITVKNELGEKINSSKSNSVDGYYYVTKLHPGRTYKLCIDDERFLKESIEMHIPETDDYDEFSKDILVYPNSKRTAVKMQVPPFEINKSKIKYGYAVLMDQYINVLTSNPDKKLIIACYPDNDKNPKVNETLTTARAESLADFFSINGIDPSRITTKGNTATDPAYPMPKEKAAKGKRYIGTTYLIFE
jgi:outer membrane protein OmpA-like peptidoglycan-associated protein